MLDVELADVRDGAALNGVVGEKLCAVVNDGCKELDMRVAQRELAEHTVEMVGAANIVTWDHSDEGSGSVSLRLLHSAKGVARERRF